ncbi:MAG: ABC transporter ATP-binding protein [candidate division NC10 bacterium]|nr:ABC transporter ATP-binding protein [candidate division NC10 bacterium]MBI4414538.1 ABC transporter ATP-binding protein [candidate division NC10 bacterium]
MGGGPERPLLEVRGAVKDFGGVRALAGVDLAVRAGARHALIGPNGAGKTTLFHLLGGQLAPTRGRILLDGVDITSLPPEARSRRGLARSFQIINCFPDATALENVQLALLARHSARRAWWRPLNGASGVRAAAEALLRRLGLTEWAGHPARQLPYGCQRRLDLAVALAGSPRLLLLDEPTAGLSPEETAEMVTLLNSLPRAQTLLVIEHDMDVVFRLAERVTVLAGGEILADGPPEAIRADPAVQRAYFGGG